jgi:thiamine biosynthesis lipoprotein
MLAVLAVTDAGVATSGLYERGPHIVDGRDGSVPTGLLSATVVADDLTAADVLATSVFALGPDGIGWALDHGARGVLALDASGRLFGAGELVFAEPAARR